MGAKKKAAPQRRSGRDEQLDELIAVLTQLVEVHKRAEVRKEKHDKQIDMLYTKLVPQLIPAVLGMLGNKPAPPEKPSHLRPV